MEWLELVAQGLVLQSFMIVILTICLLGPILEHAREMADGVDQFQSVNVSLLTC